MSTVPFFTSMAKDDPADLSVECWYRSKYFGWVVVSNLGNVKLIDGTSVPEKQYRPGSPMSHQVPILFEDKETWVWIPAARLVARTYWPSRSPQYRYIKYVDGNQFNASFSNLIPVERKTPVSLPFFSNNPRYR